MLVRDVLDSNFEGAEEERAKEECWHANNFKTKKDTQEVTRSAN